MNMTPRGSRLARGWAGAGFATAIAAVSHALAGGDAPNLFLLLLSFAVSGLVCCFLAGRVLSLGRLIAGVLASQAFFHGLFSLTPAPPSKPSPMMMAEMHHGPASMDAIIGHPAAASMSHMSGHGWQMWLGHGIAAILTIVVLRYGETSAVRFLVAVRLKITTVLRLVTVPVPAPARLLASPPSLLLPLADLGIPLPVMRHRGPPSPLAA
jgi:hypothetical protein